MNQPTFNPDSRLRKLNLFPTQSYLYISLQVLDEMGVVSLMSFGLDPHDQSVAK